jgi:hypothetical protein
VGIHISTLPDLILCNTHTTFFFIHHSFFSTFLSCTPVAPLLSVTQNKVLPKLLTYIPWVQIPMVLPKFVFHSPSSVVYTRGYIAKCHTPTGSASGLLVYILSTTILSGLFSWFLVAQGSLQIGFCGSDHRYLCHSGVTWHCSSLSKSWYDPGQLTL